MRERKHDRCKMHIPSQDLQAQITVEVNQGLAWQPRVWHSEGEEEWRQEKVERRTGRDHRILPQPIRMHLEGMLTPQSHKNDELRGGHAPSNLNEEVE